MAQECYFGALPQYYGFSMKGQKFAIRNISGLTGNQIMMINTAEVPLVIIAHSLIRCYTVCVNIHASQQNKKSKMYHLLVQYQRLQETSIQIDQVQQVNGQFKTLLTKDSCWLRMTQTGILLPFMLKEVLQMENLYANSKEEPLCPVFQYSRKYTNTIACSNQVALVSLMVFLII